MAMNGPVNTAQAAMTARTPAMARSGCAPGHPGCNLRHYLHPKKGGASRGRPAMVSQAVHRPATAVSVQPPQMQPSSVIGVGMLRGR